MLRWFVAAGKSFAEMTEIIITLDAELEFGLRGIATADAGRYSLDCGDSHGRVARGHQRCLLYTATLEWPQMDAPVGVLRLTLESSKKARALIRVAEVVSLIYSELYRINADCRPECSVSGGLRAVLR